MSEEIAKKTWTMGLGQWASVANMTAVAFVLIMFYQSRRDFESFAREIIGVGRDLAKEDREAYRQDLAALRESSIRQWDLLRKNQDLTSDSLIEIKKAVGEVKGMTREIKAGFDRMHKDHSDIRETIRALPRDMK